MALQPRSHSSCTDVGSYIAMCAGLSMQTEANSSVFHTAYIFTFRLFNDSISAVDGFIVTNGMFIVTCKYHWSNLLGNGTAVCSHCGTDHNLSTEEVVVAVILYACIREVFSSNLT